MNAVVKVDDAQSSARAVLRASQETVATAKRALAEARAAVARGHSAVNKILAEIERIDADGRRAAERQAKALAAGVAEEASRSAPLRVEAEQRLAVSSAASELLERTYEAAIDQLRRAFIEQSAAAQNVIRAEAVDLSLELVQARQRVWILTDLLASIATVSVLIPGELPATMRLPPQTLNILQDDSRPEILPGRPSPGAIWSSRWHDYYNRLLTDPNAVGEIGPDADCEGYEGETALAAHNRLSRQLFA